MMNVETFPPPRRTLSSFILVLAWFATIERSASSTTVVATAATTATTTASTCSHDDDAEETCSTSNTWNRNTETNDSPDSIASSRDVRDKSKTFGSGKDSSATTATTTATAATAATTTSMDTNATTTATSTPQHKNDCAIWLAKSSIPNAGLGMYAGKSFVQGEELLGGVGDIVIPLVDLRTKGPVEYAEDDSESSSPIIPFLWDDYAWHCSSLYCDNEGWEVDGLSNGFGAAANTVLDLVNVMEQTPQFAIPMERHYPDAAVTTTSTTSTSTTSTTSTSTTTSTTSTNTFWKDKNHANNSVYYPWHRKHSPGIGACTYYHSRKPTVETEQIHVGQELFVDYGTEWFLERAHVFSHAIPVKASHHKASFLIQRFAMLKHRLRQDMSSSDNTTVRDIVETDLWNDLILRDISAIWKSRTLAAIPRVDRPKTQTLSSNNVPSKQQQYDDAISSHVQPAWTPHQLQKSIETHGLIPHKRKHLHVQSEEWLRENGICISSELEMRTSTMEHAGNGVFTSENSKTYRKGTVVLPVPLLHIPDRKVLELNITYSPKQQRHAASTSPTTTEAADADADASDQDNDEVDKDDAIRLPHVQYRTAYQLLLNYCFGHSNSTILLSPYGPVVPLINHNQTLANVKLQWADPKKSVHQPELLTRPVWSLYNVSSASLAMELVATRDIGPNEELLLDYGNEWEHAWQHHIQTWQDHLTQEDLEYQSALELNQDERYYKLRTEFEQMFDPYPDNVMLKFNMAFSEPRHFWEPAYRNGDIENYLYQANKELVSCEILRLRLQYVPNQGQRQEYWYTISLPRPKDDPSLPDAFLIQDVPREAFSFVDRPYTSDMFHPRAFRHDIRIPDEIFPNAWHNGNAIYN